MQMRIISSAEAFAAKSLLPADFIVEPCGGCGDGKGQHMKPSAWSYHRGAGPCTRPGCDCTEYLNPQMFYGS